MAAFGRRATRLARSASEIADRMGGLLDRLLGFAGAIGIAADAGRRTGNARTALSRA